MDTKLRIGDKMTELDRLFKTFKIDIDPHTVNIGKYFIICPQDKQDLVINHIYQFFELNNIRTVKVSGNKYKEEPTIIVPSVLIIDEIFDENSVSYSNLHDIISSNCFKLRNNLMCIILIVNSWEQRNRFSNWPWIFDYYNPVEVFSDKNHDE